MKLSEIISAAANVKAPYILLGAIGVRALYEIGYRTYVAVKSFYFNDQTGYKHRTYPIFRGNGHFKNKSINCMSMKRRSTRKLLKEVIKTAFLTKGEVIKAFPKHEWSLKPTTYERKEKSQTLRNAEFRNDFENKHAVDKYTPVNVLDRDEDWISNHPYARAVKALDMENRRDNGEEYPWNWDFKNGRFFKTTDLFIEQDFSQLDRVKDAKKINNMTHCRAYKAQNTAFRYRMRYERIIKAFEPIFKDLEKYNGKKLTKKDLEELYKMFNEKISEDDLNKIVNYTERTAAVVSKMSEEIELKKAYYMERR